MLVRSVTMTQDQIYVFMGGAFSPPTYAHMEILQSAATTVAARHPAARINAFFVPVGCYYNKPSVKEDVVTQEQRLHMLLIAKDVLNAKKNDMRIDYYVAIHEMMFPQPEGSILRNYYTYESIRAFKEMRASGGMYLVIGEDNLQQIESWRNYDDLMREVDGLICCARGPPSTVPPAVSEKLIWIKNDVTQTSSTRVRELIATIAMTGELEYHIHRDILTYIYEEGLYEDEAQR